MNIVIPKMPERTIALPKKEEIIKGILIIALTRAGLAGIYPFGIALAAVFAPENAYIGFMGLIAGTALGGNGILRSVAALAAYYILIFVKKTDDINMKTVAMGISVFFARLAAFSWEGGFNIPGGIMLIPETVITACLFRMFVRLDEKNRVSRFAAIIIAGAVLNGISGVVIPYADINLSVFALIFVSMSLCGALDIPEAVLASALMGFVMNMDSSEAVAAAGMMAMAALVSSALSQTGKAGTAVGFLCGITVVSLYRGNLGGMKPADIFIPVAVFMILPSGMHAHFADRIGDMFEDETNAEKAENARIANRLRTVAGAVRDLADGVNFLPVNRRGDAMIEMFDNIADRVCVGCSLEANCRKKDSAKTYENMYGLWKAMETDGYCDYSNMPIAFKQVCMRTERFLGEFNHVYEMYKQNKLLRGEVVSGRGIMARQYGEISNIINKLSNDLETGRDESETADLKYSAAVTVRSEAKRGCAVCGDCVMHFEKNGRCYVILCDGMGSGETAMSESRLTAKLFYEFLNAGFEKETALGMINSAMALKADQESFSTADILEIDLETGVAEFLKIGSAQSFIKTKGSIEEITSKALPVGILEKIDAKAHRAEVKNNDVILMMSDGVGEVGNGVLKNEWIKRILSEEKRKDGELADLILSGAKARMNFNDDMTCIVIRIKKRR